MAEPVPPKNPFDPDRLEQYKQFFLAPKRLNLLGTPEGQTALEAERAGLASFLGTPDYDSQAKKAKEDAQRQFFLRMAERGFAAAGATPQPGERGNRGALSVLSRELFSPLAGDAGALASGFSKQERTLQAAQKAEDRQLKLAAIQNVQQRQDQTYASDVAATTQARALMQRINTVNQSVSDKYTVNGKNIPVIITLNYDGSFKNATTLAGDPIKAEDLNVYRKDDTAKPISSWLSDVEVRGADGVFIPAPNALRMANADGSNSSVVAGNTLLTFGKDGNARIVKPGSTASAYNAPTITDVFATSQLVEFLGAGSGLKVGDKIRRNQYLPKGDATATVLPFSTFTVGGKTIDLRRTADEVDGETVRTYDGEKGTVTKGGRVFSLAEFTTEKDPAEAGSVLPGETYAQFIRGNGTYGPPERVITDQRKVAAEGGGSKIVNSYYRQDPTGKVVPAKPGDFRLIDDLHGSFGNLSTITAFEDVGSVKAGDTVQVQIAPGKQGTGADDLTRYVHNGNVIDLTAENLKKFQNRPLDENQKLALGMTVREFSDSGSDLTVGDGNLEFLRQIPGMQNIGPGETIQVFSMEGLPGSETGPTVQYRYGGRTVNIPEDVLRSGVLQAGLLSEQQQIELGRKLEASESYVNNGPGPITVNNEVINPGKTVLLTRTDLARLNREKPGAAASLRVAGPVNTGSKNWTVRLDPGEAVAGGERTIRVPGRGENGVLRIFAGDEIPLNQAEFDNLSEEDKAKLTDNTDIIAKDLKLSAFKALWKQVIKENPSLTPREPTKNELDSIFARFPEGRVNTGGYSLREVIFNTLRNAQKNDVETDATVGRTIARGMGYQAEIGRQFQEARKRYEDFVGRGALPDRSWESLSFEDQRAFADLRKIIDVTNAEGLWEKARERLAADKSKFKTLSSGDVGSYAAANELLILAKYLRDTQDLDNTGRFFTGRLSKAGVNIFADFTPATSGASKRLMQVINRMKASYATLAATDGPGRDSNFKLQLQEQLIPSFTKTEAMNRKDIDSIISRLETNIRSAFDQTIMSSTVIPLSFQRMANEAGIRDVQINPARYRWLDPKVEAESPLPVTRASVMESLGRAPIDFDYLQGLRVGALLPPRSRGDERYVKVGYDPKTNRILIRRADSDGRPDEKFPVLYMNDKLATSKENR
jgi:hypothetical protein